MILRPIIALFVVAACLGGCERGPAPVVQPAIIGEPVIRVRIQRGIESLRITDPAIIEVAAEGSPPRAFTTPITFTFGESGWLLNDTPDPQLADNALLISPVGQAVLRLAHRSYPDQLRLVPLPDSPTSFDVVNHVHLEAYLPGVLDPELYDHWHLATYHAQAIAARSYAIAQMLRSSPGLWYDVEDTQASQAYIGCTADPLARQAVIDTTGLVLTCDRQIIKAYYSSTCGGAGLSPADAWGQATVPPLIPKTHEPWCADSPLYESSPITRDRDELSRRLAAFGKRYYRPIEQLGAITTMSIAQRNEVGRPSRFAITDDRGQRYLLEADTFRTACNFTDPSAGIDPLPDRRKLRTSFFSPIVKGDEVIFNDVRGYGHGVGLCQYGAQGMAQAGHDAVEILNTYYPGAKIERVY